MYTEKFTDEFNNIQYIKFLDTLGDIIACLKIEEGKETQITHLEYEKSKFERNSLLIKYFIFNFLNNNNSMLIIKTDKIESFTAINGETPNLIKYFEFGDAIENNISEFKTKEVDRFIKFLYVNKLTNLFISHCSEKLGLE